MRPYLVAFSEDYVFARDRSDWHGLIYALAGVLSVRTESGTWVVPAHRAVWVPGGTDRTIEVSAGVVMRSLYFRPRLAESLPRDCCVVNIPPLLRELILHVTDVGMLNRAIPEHARLIGVFIDQLRVMKTVPLQLPQPADARALKVAEYLRVNPGKKASLGRIAQHAGASPRTIERLFRSQTNMTFTKWRERLRLLHALRLLAAGDPITNIALDLQGTPARAVSLRCFGARSGQRRLAIFDSLLAWVYNGVSI